MKTNSKITSSANNVALIVAFAFLSSGCNSNQQEGGKMKSVTSKDGTKIVYDKSGTGHALILVNGALTSRSAYAEFVKLLSPDFAVYNYDRRGRGDSGDTRPYTVEREVDDINALIDEAGGRAYVFGISSGACLALEAAAALGDKVTKLAVYEAPYDEAGGAAEQWKQYRSKLNELLAADRHEDAVEHHMKFVGVPDTVLAGIKASPQWPPMKKLAPTIAYDVAVVGEDRSIPEDRFAKIKATTLVLDGGASLETMPFMRATADKLARTIPNAQRRTVEGQAHNVDAKVLVPLLREFYSKEE